MACPAARSVLLGIALRLSADNNGPQPAERASTIARFGEAAWIPQASFGTMPVGRSSVAIVRCRASFRALRTGARRSLIYPARASLFLASQQVAAWMIACLLRYGGLAPDAQDRRSPEKHPPLLVEPPGPVASDGCLWMWYARFSSG